MTEKPPQNNSNEEGGPFYKGLFFGLIAGVALVWFLGTPTGKEVVSTARKKVDDALAGGLGMEDYDDEEVEVDQEQGENSSSNSSASPKRFFKKKKD